MRITSKRNLPAWFDLNYYEKFAEYSDDDLFHELSCRYNSKITQRYKNNNYFTHDLKNGFGLNFMQEDNLKEWRSKLKLIDSGSAVIALGVSDVVDILEQIELDSENMAHEYSHVNGLIDDVSMFGEIFCKIDLYSSDDLIISELRYLLPKWRMKFGFEKHPVRIKTTWEKTREKIINYKSLALSDLLDWECASGDDIQYSVLAAALYPNGEYGERSIIDTIQPFTVNLFSAEVIEKFHLEIKSKKNHKKTRR
jgi:hypothetical protein